MGQSHAHLIQLYAILFVFGFFQWFELDIVDALLLYGVE